jgi:phytoene dehydrogenase-like protein
MLASWVTHLGRTPDEIGSGIWVPLTAMALMGGGMPIPEGGSEKLAQAITQLVHDQGGTIRTHTHIKRIDLKNGRAVGVLTSAGEDFMLKRRLWLQPVRTNSISRCWRMRKSVLLCSRKRKGSAMAEAAYKFISR